ncbi:uncharacterized protein K460DRAFT_149781 [Cucurbitaria berberidis CBS 394.84]|uniref:Uncharacterized protein n=1 Tax=Cucurbitaria berberidis CBS 394.84 TaxID=1168544 RepID=A0A9P4GEF3_9PLEO|nr:uncharacterized protein K460DRAFT_149781 [Cucurbitaria berberidis CBS 394.84]KAF1843700.1 hypothetical protein K460DRAFT_149781 [Cucurbitaria berberidis CBS 394.84]
MAATTNLSKMTSTAPSTDSTDWPYKLADITSKLGLPSEREISTFILEPAFLDPWVSFRDQLPLTPGVTVPPKDKDAMTALTIKIYDMMDCMATSQYDRPTYTDHQAWNSANFIECLIYQSARNLARQGQHFYTSFQRPKLKNEAGRKVAFNQLHGLAMLVFKLIVGYTSKPPSSVIRRIEAACPAKDPSRSPLPEIRVKWQLDQTPVDELRKKVLDSERRGQEEKQWLVNILMGKESAPIVEGLVNGEVKKEKSVGVVGTGMKRASGAVAEEAKKRSKTAG